VVLQGPKVSVAYVSSASLTRSGLGGLAARAAFDVALYDQQGCLSPHAIYVQRGGEVGPAAFAAAYEDPDFVEAGAQVAAVAEREVLSLVMKTPYSP